MGDVGTHESVTVYVRQQLERGLPAGFIPSSDYAYLELGNFLTDVSQFRDPPAHHRAREKVWGTALWEGVIPIFGPLIVLLGGLTSWTEELFGEDEPGREHGLLALFFRHAVLAATHQIFAEDGIARYAKLAGTLGFDPPDLDFEPLPPDEVDRVFREAFTQYWPHEHLDFPPARNLEEHREKRIFRRSRRGLLRYLEWDIQYLSEELSKLELAWIRALGADASRQEQRDLLVRLGHLLHPIEDYFFHSNFVEIRQWDSARRRNGSADPTSREGRRSLTATALRGTGLPRGSVRLRRILHRRLRYPVYEDDEPSDETSDAGWDLLYTGGFGEADIFHTIGSALETMEGSARRLGLGPKLETSRIVLFRLLFNRSERIRMIEDDLAEDYADAHEEQLMNGEVHDEIGELADMGFLSDRAEQELRRAFDVDRRIEDEYALFPGVGGMLVHILDQLQRERRENRREQERLDRDPGSIAEEASRNGASSEDVGSHSLMSKDSEDKEPLRTEAEVMAKHASASIALLLLQRVATNRDARQGLDWDTLLRYYLRFPRGRSRAWYNELLGRLRSSGEGFEQPDVDSVADQPNFGLLGPGLQPGKLAERRRGDTMDRLEAYYRAFQQ